MALSPLKNQQMNKQSAFQNSFQATELLLLQTTGGELCAHTWQSSSTAPCCVHSRNWEQHPSSRSEQVSALMLAQLGADCIQPESCRSV